MFDSDNLFEMASALVLETIQQNKSQGKETPINGEYIISLNYFSTIVLIGKEMIRFVIFPT